MAGTHVETDDGGRRLVLLAALLAAFVVVGGLGVYRYARGFWLYRGFPPPEDPAFVSTKGTAERLYVASPALGGRRQPVDISPSPPGCDAASSRRYPVFYLLHGFPGRPGAFLPDRAHGRGRGRAPARRRAPAVHPRHAVRVDGDVHRRGVGRRRAARGGWATFVSRDLVRAIDARYRTSQKRPWGAPSVACPRAATGRSTSRCTTRASSAWSRAGRGTEPPTDPSIFAHDRARLRANSPQLRLADTAGALRDADDYLVLHRLRRQLPAPEPAVATLR